ncbi:phenazine biosynthesis protein PhzF family [Fictibacillus solisalsi]|uniref:Phenazine biosynthesis protein PhzF family n=1 Tax=Fictibacillus solisalsi TaxID=459525 RepID=A0A1G9ZTJ4_9BACL|nr:PhzF family phenazine biosynthesis isomerase [Fictibacillus solisalsi]SDN24739.1 phenazine biosynthesis protein PhzF family [Fictibacillus solisalsi]
MKTVKVYHYEAFSKVPHKGNPAGVVLNGDELTEEEMQEIAHKVGFNETAFPVRSKSADLKMRFFTPGHEADLCGHATMATLFALKTKGLLGDKTDLQMETNVGVLPIQVHSDGQDIIITMQQASPEFRDFNGSIEELAHSLGIEHDDMDFNLPITYGSTGNWTLLVPIKSLDAFKRMKADNERFPSILKEMPHASVHPFCLETFDQDADMHGRHFSSPYSGTIEDPVTGTASGVMGAYYAAFIDQKAESPIHLLVEQGQEIERDGRVKVQVTKSDNRMKIQITGTAVRVDDFEVAF